MPIAINVGGGGSNQESAMDKLIKGLTLANAVLGIPKGINDIRSGLVDRDIKKEDLAKAERHRNVTYTPVEYEQLGLEASPIVQGAPSAQDGKSPLAPPQAMGKLLQPDGTVIDVALKNRDVMKEKLAQSNADRSYELQKQTNEAIRGEKRAENLDKKVEKFSKRIEAAGLTELDDVATRLESSLRLDDDKHDIAGFGATYLAPDFAVTDEGKAARQDVAALRNILLKARSGAAVTEPEFKRYMQELGEGAAKNDDQLRRGVKNTISFLRAKSQSIAAGYDPSVIKEFQSRGGKVPIGQEPPAFPRTVRNGNKTATVSNEQELKEAQAEGFR